MNHQSLLVRQNLTWSRQAPFRPPNPDNRFPSRLTSDCYPVCFPKRGEYSPFERRNWMPCTNWLGTAQTNMEVGSMPIGNCHRNSSPPLPPTSGDVSYSPDLMLVKSKASWSTQSPKRPFTPTTLQSSLLFSKGSPPGPPKESVHITLIYTY